MRLIDICEDEKVVVALWIAEKTLKSIIDKNEDYDYCRKAVDLCWDWLIAKKLSKVELQKRISNDNRGIAEITLDIEDIEVANQYGTILICVSYVTWQAYNYEEDYYYPQDLECVDDEYLEELINELMEEKFILKKDYETVLNYIVEHYNENNKIMIKQNILTMLESNK